MSRILDTLKGSLGGGVAGAALGGITGMMWGGPFGALTGLTLGGIGGGVAGGLAGLFTPRYDQMNLAYNPAMMGYGGAMQSYGGFMMPQHVMSTVPWQGGGFHPGFGGTPGWGAGARGLAGGALAGMGLGILAGVFSMPHYGMGFGGFNWSPMMYGGLAPSPFNWNAWW
jgi:hypothetical protein